MKGSYKIFKNNELSSYFILSIYEETNKLMLKMQQVKRNQDGKNEKIF